MGLRPRCWVRSHFLYLPSCLAEDSKFFDQDTGEPLPPSFGCPVRSCPFVHPDSPNWTKAPKTIRSYHPSQGSSMKRGDSSRTKTGEWPSRDLPTSPRGSSARQSRGESRDETSKMARGGESAWRSGANTTPLAPKGRGDIKTGGWGESSRSGGEESTVTPGEQN
jgi:hypothetical protein